MGLFFIYSLKVALCLTAFYLVYKLLLSRETFFGFNRAVLLAVIGLSLLLPLVHVSMESAPAGVAGFVVVEDMIVHAVADETESFVLTAAQAAFIVYVLGVLFFSCRWAWSLVSLYRLMRGGRVVDSSGGIRIIVVDGDVSPFSWMGNIVISAKDYAGDPRYILTHERAHIYGRHSADILLCDALIVFQWFNPSAWLLKAELQNLHEYEADSAVLSSGADAAAYQLMLIRKAVGDKLFTMANNLNQCSLKKRITMMMKKKSNPWRRVRTLLVAPVAAVAVVAFATPKAESLGNEIMNESDALVSAVMPAGGTPSVQAPQVAATAGANAATGIAGEARQAAVTTGDNSLAGGDDDKVYNTVEEMPEFPGGQNALMRWLADNLKYPMEAAEAGIQGRVVVKFVIDKNGNVTNPTVARSVCDALDAEALRIVRSMPKWTPGKQDGKCVAVEYSLPVVFRIAGGKNGTGIDILNRYDLPKNGRLHMSGNMLYVVDGKQVDDIKNYNLDDIESIEVNKDKETIAKYGDAAKNGVISIKLKKK